MNDQTYETNLCPRTPEIRRNLQTRSGPELAPERQVCCGSRGGVGPQRQPPLLLESAGPRRRWGEGDGGQARLGGRSAKPIGCLATRKPAPAGTMRYFKKNLGHSLRTVRQRYERIDAMKNEHPISTLCLHLEVSPSGYYAWQERRNCPGPRAVEDQALAQEIDQIHAKSRQT